MAPSHPLSRLSSAIVTVEASVQPPSRRHSAAVARRRLAAQMRSVSQPRRPVNEVLRTISASSGERRVEIYRRPDGTFGFEEWRYDESEQAWLPFGRYSHAIIDTLENAEREARARVSWLAVERTGAG